MDKTLEFDGPNFLQVSQQAGKQAGKSVSDRDFTACLQLYAELLVSAEEQGGNPADVAPLHYRLGQVHDEMRQFRNAEVHYRAAAYSFERSDLPQQEAQVQLLLGEIKAHLGLPKAKEAFTRAKDLGDRIQNTFIQARSLYNLGRLKEFGGDFTEALADYKDASKLVGMAEDTQSQALYANLEISLIEVQKALKALIIQQALELAERINREIETPVESGEEGDRSEPPFGRPRIVRRASGVFPDSVIYASQGSRSWR